MSPGRFVGAASLCAPARHFVPDSELIDRAGTDRAFLWDELRALEQLNRRLGGHRLVLDAVQHFVKGPLSQPLRILDLATGGADVPRCLAQWLREIQQPCTITAVDRNPVILEYARECCRDWPEIHLEEHDLRDLPYEAESFDIVLCSLALHHFGEPDSIAIMRQMQRLARGGYIVNDLRRNWLSVWMTQFFSRAFYKSPAMRHDAPQSVRAAFTVNELRELAQQAGLKNFEITLHHGVFRMVLSGRK